MVTFFFLYLFACRVKVFLRTREQITDIICMALAGRASEQVHFGDVSSENVFSIFLCVLLLLRFGCC